MKCLSSLLFAAAAASVLRADETALTTSAVDAGGGFSSGDAVEINGSLGGFGGVSGDAELTATSRAGFTGQIYDPVRVAITPGSAELSENVIVDFTGQVVCDDDTILAGEPVTWFTGSNLLSVSTDGRVAAAATLPGSFSALLTATAAGVSGTALLTVTDTSPDDYGDYAGDGLPDQWQIQFFGDGNREAKPENDPDQDGQDNRTEYLAGTDPTDPGSLLRLFFSTDSPPGTRLMQFSPFLPNRQYRLESSFSLDSGWTESPGSATEAPTPGHGMISDQSGPDQRKFYRLKISEQ